MFAAAVMIFCKKKGGLFCYKADGNTKIEMRAIDGFTEIESNSDFTINYT